MKKREVQVIMQDGSFSTGTIMDQGLGGNPVKGELITVSGKDENGNPLKIIGILESYLD